MKSVEAVGKTYEEALASALNSLGVEKDQVEIQVLEEGTKGFLGFGAKPTKIKVTLLNTIKATTEKFLRDVLDAANINAEFKIEEEKDTLKINISGEEASMLIGRRGEALDSLQFLVSLLVNKEGKDYMRVILDIENYRQKREESLIRFANKMARSAVKSRRNLKLEPMNPYERRIIHAALQSDPYVTTYSEGDEPYRRIVISLKKRDYRGKNDSK